MTRTGTITVSSCITCPMRQHHRGHGEAWYYCSHPNAPRGYDNIINDIEVQFPVFCPLTNTKQEEK